MSSPDTPPTPSSIQLRLPPFAGQHPRICFPKKVFTWRARSRRPLRPFTPCDDARLVSLWYSHLYQNAVDLSEELAFETAAVQHLDARLRGMMWKDAARSIHFRLLRLLCNYQDVLQGAQHQNGATLAFKQFEQFLVVFTVLRGQQLTFREVSWDADRHEWKYDDIADDQESGASRLRSSSSPSSTSKQESGASSDSSAIASSCALTIERRSPNNSDEEASAVPVPTPNHGRKEKRQKNELLHLTLPAPADALPEPLVLRNITFNRQIESTEVSHMRRLTAMDNTDLVTFWKTEMKEYLDKPELDFECSAVKVLHARRKSCSTRTAAYQLHHHLASLLRTYDHVLNHARTGGAIVDAHMFADFASVYAALRGRGVAIRNAPRNFSKQVRMRKETEKGGVTDGGSEKEVNRAEFEGKDHTDQLADQKANQGVAHDGEHEIKQNADQNVDKGMVEEADEAHEEYEMDEANEAHEGHEIKVAKEVHVADEVDETGEAHEREEEVDQEATRARRRSISILLEKPAQDVSASVAGHLPPRKRRSSSLGSNAEEIPTKGPNPNREDSTQGVKRRRLNQRKSEQSSQDGPSSVDGKSCTRATQGVKHKNHSTDGEMKDGKCEQIQRVQKAHQSYQEQAAEVQANHQRHLETLQELCKSALAFHAAGMREEASKVVDRFIALIDKK